MAPQTFAVLTYGCKVNQYESQALREDLVRRGYREVASEEIPSTYIVNTCTVTEVASAEARRTVRKLRRRNPDARIVVTGCAAETDRAEFAESATVVRQPVPFGIRRFDGHTRAFLKVEDGCDLHCSFCIIPHVRGGASSRPLNDAVDEAKRLLDNGYREIVLTGIHLGGYDRLPDLIERLLALPALGRVRLSSIEVNEINEPLLDLMVAEPRRFCPHLHLPLQSGDDAILRAMRRRYNVRQFLAACDRVAERVPDPAFTTDVIVGFPGETDAQFENSVEVCRRVGVSRIHIFPYSPRRGTDAAKLPDDVPGREKKRRLRRLKTEAHDLTRKYAAKFVGRPVDVLVEKDDGTGYTERYLKTRAPGVPRGSLVTRTFREVLS